jgi:hypothetical protein
MHLDDRSSPTAVAGADWLHAALEIGVTRPWA